MIPIGIQTRKSSKIFNYLTMIHTKQKNVFKLTKSDEN